MNLQTEDLLVYDPLALQYIIAKEVDIYENSDVIVS